MTILHQIPTDAKIRRIIKKIVFGQHLFCPLCGSRSIKKYERRYFCKRCRQKFSLFSSTWLKDLKLPLPTFWLLLWCWTNKVPFDQTKKVTGLTTKTIRNWFNKFRSHLPLEDIVLEGLIQLDEAYRHGLSIIGAKQIGNSDKNKKQGKRRIAFQIIDKKSVDRIDALNFLKDKVVPGSTLNTDGASIYKGISNWWPVKHGYERHNRFEFEITSEIEGLWGNFFTFVKRMYHHMRKDQVYLYLLEFQARFCHPEWFQSPVNNLNVSLSKLQRVKSQKIIKNPIIFSPNSTPVFMLTLAKKQEWLVPSSI